MVKMNAGFDPKKGQVHNVISVKIGGVEQQLAHFRIIRNYMRVVAEAEAEGGYTVEISSPEKDQAQLRCMFCFPSGGTRTFGISRV